MYTNRVNLLTGIIYVILCNLFLIIYLNLASYLFNNNFIQNKGRYQYNIFESLLKHFSYPEGFILLTLYLTLTWEFNLLPTSYYNFEEDISFKYIFIYLLCLDLIQYIMHRYEHSLSKTFPYLYNISHKLHHRYLNPKFFDAFSGSIIDTIIMILIPLFITSNIIQLNGWSYITSGCIYSSWLTLIHSQFSHPWDFIFKKFSLGTPADHHVHHVTFKYNYGHLFMFWDKLFGTYKDPSTIFLNKLK